MVIDRDLRLGDGAAPASCPCCRIATPADFWQAAHGWVCGVCHPEPAKLAAAWLAAGGAAPGSASAHGGAQARVPARTRATVPQAADAAARLPGL